MNRRLINKRKVTNPYNTNQYQHSNANELLASQNTMFQYTAPNGCGVQDNCYHVDDCSSKKKKGISI